MSLFRSYSYVTPAAAAAVMILCYEKWQTVSWVQSVWPFPAFTRARRVCEERLQSFPDWDAESEAGEM
jgi:hypothetical protein